MNPNVIAITVCATSTAASAAGLTAWLGYGADATTTNIITAAAWAAGLVAFLAGAAILNITRTITRRRATTRALEAAITQHLNTALDLRRRHDSSPTTQRDDHHRCGQ